jgi:HK97 family phage prohead protease
VTTTQTIIRAAPPLAVKLAGAATAAGVIEGYASVFEDEPDSYGDIIARGAFTKGLAELKQRSESVLMLWAHDTTAPIGRWTDVEEDTRGLFVRGQLNLETDSGRNAHAHLKAGDVNGLSIGYQTVSGATERHKNGTQTLHAVNLKEVSVVTFPALRSARVTAVKTEIRSQRELDALLREGGLPRAAAAKIAAAGWPALNSDQDQPDLNRLEARIKAATADLIRSMKG